MDFRQLQDEQRPWREYNFPYRDSYYPLLGAVEEIGEIAHSYLKWKQAIRGTASEHYAKMADGVADAIIFLSDFCSAMGFDLQTLMEETWAEVKQRDWIKFPRNGLTE